MFSSSRWPPSPGVGVPHGSAILFRAPQMSLPFTIVPAVYLGSVVVLVLTGILGGAPLNQPVKVLQPLPEHVLPH